MQDCDPKTYSCTSSGRKDAKIAHIKRRVPLGEKTTHIDKAQMQKNTARLPAHSTKRIHFIGFIQYGQFAVILL